MDNEVVWSQKYPSTIPKKDGFYDILIFSKIIDQHKDDALTRIQRWINYDIALDKKKHIYAEQEIEFYC